MQGTLFCAMITVSKNDMHTNNSDTYEYNEIQIPVGIMQQKVLEEQGCSLKTLLSNYIIVDNIGN